ncbi:hypothetical protein [Streptomyces sp. NPDC051567]|uniref:hypothetical protein n=1 Tax=Streptomyces sp. NPDC051567 TaxID=3365660 RepID=UPI00379227F9
MTLHRIGETSRPSAGALRLVEARTSHPITVAAAPYAEAVTAHCPYLRASLDGGLNGWTVYEIASDDTDAVEAEVFWACVQAAEWVRPLTARGRGAFVCENVVITGRINAVPHRRLMGWPHWALKHLYGAVGLMIGKFGEGESTEDGQGRRIPAPPFSFLPVRPAVRPVDPRFLHATPTLAGTVATSADDGRDVFAPFPAPDWKAVKAWSSSLPAPLTPTPRPRKPAEAPSS